MVLLLYCRCQISYTLFVLEASILLPPLSLLFQNISTSSSSSSSSSSTGLNRHGPRREVEDIMNMTSGHSKAHSLKAAIFHTMAYKLSLEINNNKITPKTLIAFLEVLYNVAQIKKKRITFEQYSRLHVAGPKIAICETASNVVFVLNSAFTSKDQYFHAAPQEVTDAFNEMLVLDIHKNSNFMTLINIRPIHLNNILCTTKHSTSIFSLYNYISS